MQQTNNDGTRTVEVRWNKNSAQNKSDTQQNLSKHERVAAYCRVSTYLDDQVDSFELQRQYYLNLIQNTQEWDLVEIYADRGITGTQRNTRPGFQRMIQHCEEGKIDRILCKSISRFARNTIDMLNTIRYLKDRNIRVIFEKEAIDTLSIQSEFILSTIAAIAQDESRSISENMLWSFKKRFESGVPVFKRILGYDIEKNENEAIIRINESEADIVREIYSLALVGKGYTQIARIMEAKGYYTANGRLNWTVDLVRGILTNERYTGDVLCQKSYTLDYLTHRHKRNNGKMPQYLIENYHIGIISKELFQEVQTLINNRKRRS